MLRVSRSICGDCFDGFDRHSGGYVTLPLADSFGYATTAFDIGVEIGVWTVLTPAEWFKLRFRH